MAANPLACDTCPVRDRAACAALDPAEREELARLGRHRTLKRGEALVMAGEEQPICATLISGVLKIVAHGEDGTERLLSLVHPAGFAGEMFAPAAHHDVIAVADSRLCVFAHADYQRAIERFPALARALLRRTADDLLATRELVALQSRRDSRSRVAGLLMSLAEAASESPCHPAERFDLPMTRGDMAALTGLTIETVSRQLGRLEQDGLITREGARGIRLADPARLRLLAN